MDITQNERLNLVRTAAVIALVGNGLLAALKIVVGWLAGSSALVADGIDSSGDVLISLITLAVASIISKPADTGHPWGHGRAETIATALLSFVLFFMGTQMIIGSVAALFSPTVKTVPSSIAMVVSLVSVAGKIILAISQYIMGKRADSAMVQANAKNMAADVLISLSVFVGLAVSTLTGSANTDSLLAALIGAWIIKTAIGIFMEANVELMDGNNNMEQYGVIVDAVNSVPGAANPHRARMRRIAGLWDIDLDIDVEPTCTISEAHDIASQVEAEIRLRLNNVFDIMVHVEPSGNNTEEGFGLSEYQMGNQ